MRLIRKYHKYIAAFLLLNVLNYLFFPTRLLASAPTTPEVTGFEPIENVDLVNLTSGDFNYNKLLLNVPSASSGFPLSMSYHAGISPNQEASWVGLGWSMNVGAISRRRVGFPDDWKDVEEKWTEHWVGGTTTVASVSLTAPVYEDGADKINLTLGLNYVKDTYKGSALGYEVGLSESYAEGIAQVGYTYRSNRILGNSLTLWGSVGIPLNKKNGGKYGLGVSGSVTLQGDKLHTSTGLSLSYNNSISANYSSDGSFNIGSSNAMIVSSYSKQGHVSNSTSGFNAFIPFSLNINENKHSSGVNVSFNQTTYRIDESDQSFINGALYFPDQVNDISYYDNRVYDISDSPELNIPGENELRDKDYPRYNLGNEMLMGGTFPNYDGYMINTQGISGGIKPVNYLENLPRQNVKITAGDEEVYKVKQYVGKETSLPENEDLPEFSFSEFSNYYIYDRDNNEKFNAPLTSDPLQYDFYDSEIETVLDKNPSINDNSVPQGKYVKWFSNADIVENRHTPYGFMENVPSTFKRADMNPDLIGGFLATNTSGMTYHYSLPAYIKNEEVHQYHVYPLEKNPDDPSRWIKNIRTIKESYAYAWHLTGVTGPDYVDRGGGSDGSSPNGILDDADWGHWVKFDYGLWTDQYNWRIPEIGYNESYDGNFKSFNKGQKEIYYLNKITTSTHTALFIKDIREDGHGLADMTDHNSSFSAPSGGPFPAALLKLSKIVVIPNKQLPELNMSLNNSYSGTHPNYGGNVLLSENISSSEWKQINNSILDGVDFNTDYSLMPDVPNSFLNDYYPNGSRNNVLSGKLTLKSTQSIGKGGLTPVPAEQYSYKNPTESFCQDCSDYWGYYKSDFNDEIRETNLKQMPTLESAKKIDSWSLNNIKTALGGTFNINYEADDFGEVSLEGKTSLSFSSFTNEGMPTNQFKASFNGLTSGDLSKLFYVEQNVSAVAVITDATHKKWKMSLVFDDLCKDIFHFQLNDLNYYMNEYKVLAVNEDHIVLQLVDFDSDFIDYSVPTYSEVSGQPDGDPKWNCGGPLCDKVGGWTRTYKDFIGGEIYFNVKDNNIGGGLRVKSIEISSEIDAVTKIYTYEYTDGQKSSGSAPYIPVQLNQFDALNYPDFYKDKTMWYKGGEECEPPIWPWVFAPLAKEVKVVSEKVLDWVNPRESGSLTLPLKEEFIQFKRSKILNKARVLQRLVSNEVIYRRVKVGVVEKRGTNFYNQGYDVYEFQPFSEAMAGVTYFAQESFEGGTASGETYRSMNRKGVHFQNLLGAVGSLKYHAKYDNNNKLLSSIQYIGLHDALIDQSNFMERYEQLLTSRFKSQGIFSQVYINGRLIPYDESVKNDLPNYKFDLVGMISKQTDYPTIPYKLIHTDHRKGIVTQTQNLEFDFYTGAPTKILSEDEIGNKSLTYTIPAYQLNSSKSNAVAAFPEMGLKSKNLNYKNMLSQEGASFQFSIDKNFDADVDLNVSDNIKGLFGAALQTWSDSLPLKIVDGPVLSHGPKGLFRKKLSYSYIGNGNKLNGDGTLEVTISDITNLRVNNIGILDVSGQQGWQESAEVLIYDAYSHALESKDINGNKAASKFDKHSKQILATAANSSYTEFAYSGAEDWDGGTSLGGGVLRNSSSVLSANSNGYSAHTGDKSFGMSSGTKGVGYFIDPLVKGRNYVLSFWSTRDDCQIGYKYDESGGEILIQGETLGKVNGWYLIEAIIPAGDHSNMEVFTKGAVGAPLFQVDDFRVHPLDASMQSYVYNDRGQLTEILDASNFFKRYEYDAAGNLQTTSIETIQYGIKKLSEHTIEYARNQK